MFTKQLQRNFLLITIGLALVRKKIYEPVAKRIIAG